MQPLKNLQQVIQHDLFRSHPLIKEPIRKERGGIPIYRANRLLLDSAKRLQSLPMKDLFARDPGRADRFSVEAAGISFDYSKNLLDAAVVSQLLSLAEEAGLPAAIDKLYRGKLVNGSELQPALHTALRDFSDSPAAGAEIQADIQSARNEMLAFAERLRAGKVSGVTGKVIKRIVVIGIGGSYLGPKLACEALKDYVNTELTIDFIASLDPAELFDVLDRVDLEETLFIVSSKSFGTVETITNATVIKEMLVDKLGAKAVNQHMVAVTANRKQANEFGFESDRIFPIWSWVGGRYSLWSSIGLPVAIAVGSDRFKQLLKGAWQMDRHFRRAPLEHNMPVMLALTGIWNRNYLKSQHHAVLPYSHRLRSLPEYLQQLEMESNGKTTQVNGLPVKWATGPVVWGGMGNLGQHAYYQLMHQGSDNIPADIILIKRVVKPAAGKVDSTAAQRLQNSLLSNAIGQTQALMQGKNLTQVRQEMYAKGCSTKEIRDVENHLVVNGSRPSNALTMELLTPETLGALLALYEAKVYVQSVIWNINAFDQWSVELGKGLAKEILPLLEGQVEVEATASQTDTSTQNLINRCL